MYIVRGALYVGQVGQKTERYFDLGCENEIARKIIRDRELLTRVRHRSSDVHFANRERQ